ncbi:MAG: 16S rRNA (cytidine(1402)-2'-O)-methyltransferase [Desulfobacteraceae bacterium]|jgi:16S rRNA (cytidine1402-2'-O)-methyltransferase
MPSNSPIRNRPEGTLYIVATPIGNLEDITLRAIRVLKEVDLIAAEDTRHTRRLLTAHGIHTPVTAYHEHNEQRKTSELIEKLQAGTCMALVTDAGTPAVSDPGYRLVQAAVDRRIPVSPIPGVSAPIAALSAAGLATDAFTFVGFPPRKKSRRLSQLEQLAKLTHTVVYYQSPKRVLQFLKELLVTCGDRPAVLARELTKMHEEFLRGSISQVIAGLENRQEVKGECTLLISGAIDASPSKTDIDAAIIAALESSEQSLSRMAKDLALRLGVTRKSIYDRALELKKE